MPVLTDQQRKFYEDTQKVTKQEIADLENQIQEELQRVKQRIAELQAKGECKCKFSLFTLPGRCK